MGYRELRHRLKLLHGQLERLAGERAARHRPMVVQGVEVAHAGGRPCGYYPDKCVLVFDPAAGEPRLPPELGPPWPLLIVSEGATFDTVL